MRAQFLTALLIAAMLAGCTSHPVEPVLPHASQRAEPAPSQVPYWDNPQWINDLGKTINNHLVYPVAAEEAGPPSAHAVVQFTYDNGTLDHVRIIKSTGIPIIDSAIVTQVPQIKPPLAEGPNKSMPRVFQLRVTLTIRDPQFTRAILVAISKTQFYPRSAIIDGDQGWVVVRFQYRNGSVLKSSIAKWAGVDVFRQAALETLSHAQLPSPPSWARDKTLTMSFGICYAFSPNFGSQCPSSEMGIHYESNNKSVPFPMSDCTLVGYDYKDGKIADVHLENSSGDTDRDKAALLTVTHGNFPQPAADLRSTESGFLEPVCGSH